MACEEFKQRYIGKIVRVTTRNQRVFYGKLAAVDDKSNMLLYETAAEIPQQMSHPINLTLTNILDDELRSNRYLDTSGVSEEQAGKLVSSFAKNKYYFGPVMIASTDIAKVEMQRRVIDKPAEPMPAKHMPHKVPEEEKQKEDKPKQLTEHTSEPAENTTSASEQAKREKQE